MASNGPIDDYLTDLHRRVARWHRRPADVVAEAADHLGERVDALMADGLDRGSAAANAIADYGTPEEVADAHLRSARRPAIPTADTRTMGTAGIIGGLAWIALPVLAVGLPSDSTIVWLGLAQVFFLAIGMSIVGMLALWRRHGGLGPLSYAAIVPAVLATPFVLFVWPIPAWAMLLGLATLLFGIPVVGRRLVPLSSAMAITTGLAITGAAVLGAEFFATRTGEDYAFLESTAATIAMIAGMAIFGLGLIGVGRWMRSEEPVAIPPLPAPAAT